MFESPGNGAVLSSSIGLDASTRRPVFPAAVLTLIGVVTWFLPAAAAADAAGSGLFVAPTRLVFEGGRRAGEITVVNTGSAPGTYRISPVHLRMGPNGEMQEIAEPAPDELSAHRLVRFSPRQVVLEPQVSQTVRVQLRKPAGLPAGEYRSHLLLRAVPEVETADPMPAAPAAGTRGPLHVNLRAVFGVSIPVIVRHGATSATVRIADVRLVPSGAGKSPAVSFTIHRIGNQSVYGDVSVAFVSKSGSEKLVGAMRGMAVYTPNASRRVVVPLQIDRLPPENYRLHVSYAGADHFAAPLAEAEIAVP